LDNALYPVHPVSVTVTRCKPPDPRCASASASSPWSFEGVASPTQHWQNPFRGAIKLAVNSGGGVMIELAGDALIMFPSLFSYVMGPHPAKCPGRVTALVRGQGRRLLSCGGRQQGTIPGGLQS
jgi:hypothetical protein